MLNALNLDKDRVAIYVRSGEDRRDPDIEDQIRVCRSFLNREGIHLRKDLVFSDERVSGKTLERTGLSKLREMVKAGRISAVVVWRLDRLSVDLFDCVLLVRREWANRCFLISVHEDFHTGGPSGERLFDILQRFLEAEAPDANLLWEVLSQARSSKADGAEKKPRRVIRG